VIVLGSYQNHFELYKKFKKDAENPDNYEGTRVEAYFLSSFQLIEACAAKEHVHINKHQNVRTVLEQNRFIFGDNTDVVWRSFQKIENQFRPKFAYGFTWSKDDLNEVIKNYSAIEATCLEKFK
jgi:hypothetical protein